MATQSDPLAVRKALDQARSQRTQITRGAPLPIDTAHLVGACVTCGRLGFTVLGFPDQPYAGPAGQPRYRNATELLRFVEELLKRPPPMPSPEDTNNGTQCACGTPADPREVMGVRLMHAMPGSGAELIAEGVRGGRSLLVSASGGALGGDEFSWAMYRAPFDGIESEIAASFDDRAIEKAFGRPLTLARTWRRLLDAATAGTETLESVEPGYWLFTGPADDAGLDAKVAEIVAASAERQQFSLQAMGEVPPLPGQPGWGHWAYEHADAIRSKKLRAGVILDRDIVRKLVEAQLARLNVPYRLEQNNNLVVAAIDDARWPTDVSVVAVAAAHLGWTLTETVAAAVSESAQRVQVIAQFLAGARKYRPEVEFKVNGLTAIPMRKDGTAGRPINLAMAPFRLQPGTPDFEREIRFVADEIPPGADPTRVSPDGSPAYIAARIFPWNVVEEFRKSTSGASPMILGQYPDGQPKAALLATIADDLHVRIPTEGELKQAGLDQAGVEKRLAEDLKNSLFAVDVSLHEDNAKRRALLAYGPLVASCVMNDHLVSALHAACGKPLRQEQVEAQVTTPNLICMYENNFDDDRLDQLLEQGASADGIPPGGATPFSLTWDVSLTAAPVGRFVNLYPPPAEQQQGQPGAPQRPGAPRPPPRRN